MSDRKAEYGSCSSVGVVGGVRRPVNLSVVAWGIVAVVTGGRLLVVDIAGGEIDGGTVV